MLGSYIIKLKQCIKHPKGLIKDLSLAKVDMKRTVIYDYDSHSISLNKGINIIIDNSVI